MPGGGNENANTIAARFNPQNPHAFMKDDAIAGKCGTDRRGEFFIFPGKNLGIREHDHTTPETTHRLSQRESIRICPDDDKARRRTV